MLGGAVCGVMGQLVLGHGPMGVWVFIFAVAAGGLSGLVGLIRRDPDLYWSGLLEWCFTPSHAVRHGNWCAAPYVDHSPVKYAAPETIVVRWQLP
jgi:hypothetical protein